MDDIKSLGPKPFAQGLRACSPTAMVRDKRADLPRLLRLAFLRGSLTCKMHGKILYGVHQPACPRGSNPIHLLATKTRPEQKRCPCSHPHVIQGLPMCFGSCE